MSARRNLASRAVIATSLALALAAAGCSSSGAHGSPGGTSATPPGSDAGSAGGGTASGCAQQAQAKVDAATKPVRFSAPTTPVNAGKAAGKSVWYIAPDLSLPFIKAIADGFTAAATAAGLKPTVFDGKGNVNTFNQGVSSAVAQKADGLLLQGINPALVSGPLAQATAAHMSIVDSLNGSPDAPLSGGVQAHVTVDYKLGGQLMADEALAVSKCTGDQVFFTSSIYKVYVDMLAGFKSEISALCPSCGQPTVVDVAPTDLATKLPTLTSTELRRHPSAKALVAAYDGMVQFMSPSIQEASSKVVIVSHDGVDSNLQAIRAGNTPQVATVSNPPNEAMGWAEIDQLLRLLTGAQPVVPSLPQQIFVKANTAASSAAMFPGYSGYQAAYKKLWGLG